ncbi:MAG: transcription antitermination factor NusB [Dongiaceae bacterium]
MSEPIPATDPRRAARLAAVQALYQIALTGATPEAAITEFTGHRLSKPLEVGGTLGGDPQLFADLVRGAAEKRPELDRMISAVLTNDWTVERLEAVLLAVLRVGAYELSARPDLPARVAISEYVAIAGAFLGDRETGLVNGLLDRMARSLRPEAFEPGGRHGGGKASG